MEKLNPLWVILLALFIASCNQSTKKQATIETDENGVAILSNEQVEEIVKRSYQYLAMYNVNNKGSIARAFLLTEALTLEGKVSYPKLVPPTPEVIASSPETFVDYYRVRIDPKKSENTDKVIEFIFTDKGNKAVGLHIRGGIVEYIPVPADYYKETDYTIKMDSETWPQLYLNSVTLTDAIDSGKVKITGNQNEVVALFELFDKFQPTKNYKIPPLED